MPIVVLLYESIFQPVGKLTALRVSNPTDFYKGTRFPQLQHDTPGSSIEQYGPRCLRHDRHTEASTAVAAEAPVATLTATTPPQRLAAVAIVPFCFAGFPRRQSRNGEFCLPIASSTAVFGVPLRTEG